MGLAPVLVLYLQVVVGAVLRHVEQVLVVLQQSLPGRRRPLQDLQHLLLHDFLLHGR